MVFVLQAEEAEVLFVRLVHQREKHSTGRRRYVQTTVFVSQAEEEEFLFVRPARLWKLYGQARSAKKTRLG